ncbi:hypothetical protein GOODEAATRI_026457 [Goodea atripinnis]|uniref:Uncharacterized protein n=1 Tax=Goodea atripinnis TaxID=208336 RepID=A0ABV0NNG1_9TELE
MRVGGPPALHILTTELAKSSFYCRQLGSTFHWVCFYCCRVMLAFVWLLWRLFHVTLGGPILHPTWPEGMVPATNSVPSPTFYRLPVFLHAPTPLVPQELFRPIRSRNPLPAELTGLLIPPLRQHQSIPDKVAHAVEAWCGTENVSVRVDRILLRAWNVPTLFRIGSCSPSAVTSRYLYFQYGMLECGGRVQVRTHSLLQTDTLCL